jgi:hypothetical protein
MLPFAPGVSCQQAQYTPKQMGCQCKADCSITDPGYNGFYQVRDGQKEET